MITYTWKHIRRTPLYGLCLVLLTGIVAAVLCGLQAWNRQEQIRYREIYKTIPVTLRVTDLSGSRWDKLKADWEETTIYSFGMGLACPSEPTFPYEAVELYEEAGMINVSNYLYIVATEDCVDLFVEHLLTEGAIIDGTRVEYASSTNSDGNTVLTADAYTVEIEWDSSNGMILATFTY